MSRFPTTENGISMLVNAEWHADHCKASRTRMYMDCDCSLSRAIAAAEVESARAAHARGVREWKNNHAAQVRSKRAAHERLAATRKALRAVVDAFESGSPELLGAVVDARAILAGSALQDAPSAPETALPAPESV